MKKKVAVKKVKKIIRFKPERVQTAEGRRRAMLRELNALKSKAA